MTGSKNSLPPEVVAAQLDGPVAISPVQAMRLAIAEGEKGWGSVSPNPLVGCVIVDRGGRLLATGYHVVYGGPHAEIDALSKISDRSLLEGATVYVTLEPCARKGPAAKTGSCAVALAALPLKRVVYGLIDPNEVVSGKGVAILREARIEALSISEVLRESQIESQTDRDSLRTDLERLCEHFLWNQQKKLPFVALKSAVTSDGFTASHDGTPRWISNETSRAEVHRLRAGFDAVLVGKNTFLTDNPSLDVRIGSFDEQASSPIGAARYLTRKNKAIVLDRTGEALSRLPGSNLLKARPADHIYWVVDNPNEHHKLAEQLGIHLVQGPISQALHWFFKDGITSIFVEGGATVHSQFIEEKLAQRLYLFIAPQLSGAANAGASMAGSNKIHSLKNESWSRPFPPAVWQSRNKMRDIQESNLNGDIYWTARFD